MAAKCIRDIQKGRRGIVPVRTAMVEGENGNEINAQPYRSSTGKMEETLQQDIQYPIKVNLMQRN
jgi:hypothetical protein